MPAVAVDPVHGRLTATYFSALGILSAALAFEMFDFVIISFLLSALAPVWKLTFGQTAIILLAASAGAILGSALAGPLADSHGRRPVLIAGLTLCPLAAAAIAFLPEGAWIGFSLLRLLLGVGYGMAGVAQFTLIVELTPVRHRTLLASATMIPVAIGFLMAPTAMSLLYGTIGWRGLALLGGIPIVFAALVATFVPESPDWLMSHGHVARARDASLRLFGVAMQPGSSARGRRTATEGRLLDHPRELIFVCAAYGLNATAIAGVLMWGPVIVGMLFAMPPQRVASFFLVVGVSGLLGRIAFTLIPARIGRRRAGQLHSFAAAALLASATLLPAYSVLGVPYFLIGLAASAFFFDGGLANLQPHAAEVFPTPVAARGMAASQIAVGVGKIVGPVILALLAGTSNVVLPQATRDAVQPGFLTMAALFAMTGLTFTFLGKSSGSSSRAPLAQ